MVNDREKEELERNKESGGKLERIHAHITSQVNNLTINCYGE